MGKKKSQLMHGLVVGHVSASASSMSDLQSRSCGPYFTVEEAARIKGVSSPTLTEMPEFEELEFGGDSEHHLSQPRHVSLGR
ncbi:predicted protein [Botrytis cinerea T4]|uniref:Uncharacterized protein n=1 Tax=Botryotinia fuckeliana (strain T4) TaxID=999810 RepID=G2YGM4_BOTF4|nr:predicted protein [Botrytis cinerea T4]